ncbi:tRNA (adenosine(37)-N6)-dimethylallyltransferase MiaA [Tateyamaria sp. ANG-S1]|uniref:tRNA (adenosine(37)-N6)-dimethylallyltransferase MiaA n=1 Tax=Tateyamaria sp. ANG-S1 TaxID=1577905 RepID=UPI00057CCD4A|nr:tRNA (adenosine(37)-N6)-dimethylallyltransferase MiaA [Tateyamaria sp. ANG-S1]KIC48969.1 tRNA delta(2)-isopentenylpyrophosphate transferase [Tateyamaria sp. ANG-S1]
MIRDLIAKLSKDLPVLIAGPTASGKSALALAIAEAQGGVIVNADASQIYDCWRVLTARPSTEEEARAPHLLYGHVAYDAPYSTGHWLQEVTPLLGGPRPIIVGGTGLYFSALTEGLADIPATPPDIRALADTLDVAAMLADLDPETISRIDSANRARVQRAWEVQQATGQPLAHWQDQTRPPVLKAGSFTGIVMESPKEWLTPRIEARFDQMLKGGALDEARAMQDRFDPALPACRAIGAAEAMAVLRGEIDHDTAVERATIATRQYAKRQRTWFRARMADWHRISSPDLVAT